MKLLWHFLREKEITNTVKFYVFWYTFALVVFTFLIMGCTPY